MARKAKVLWGKQIIDRHCDETKSLKEMCDEIESLLEGIEDLTTPCLGTDEQVCDMRDRILDLLDAINKGEWKT